MSTPNAELPNFAKTASGPVLIGTFISLVLYGVLITQCSVYFKAQRKDPAWIRMLVLLLVVLEGAQSTLSMAFIYDRLINNFGNLLAQAETTIVIEIETLIVGVIGMLVQLFFGWRVRVLTGKKWLGWVVTFLAVVSGVASIILPILGWTLGKGLLHEGVIVRNMVILWLVGAATTDTVITIILVAYLHHIRTGIANTDRIIDRIIRVTVQTGLLTAISAAVNLVLYLASPTTTYFLMLNVTLAKLYSNSLVSSLNMRSSWNYDSNGNTSNSVDSQPFKVRRNVNISNPRRHPEVFVDIDSHELRDMEGPRSSTVEWQVKSPTDQ